MSSSTRYAARAVLLTPEHRVLLMQMAFPWAEQAKWLLPGGGIEAGETAQAACLRELEEETGLRVSGPLDHVWQREFVVPEVGVMLNQQYFLLRVDEFEPSTAGFTAAEHDWFKAFRWWTLAELAVAEVEPPGLAVSIRRYLKDGVPPTPIQL